jgi:2-polyprenyl-6-methoxyphenol hydroxylase-like FAD-dependent oxidoreductase
MNMVFGRNGFFGYFPSSSSLSSPARDSAHEVSEPGDQLGWWSTYAMEECPRDPRNINRDLVAKELRERHAAWKDPVVQEVIGQENIKIENIYPTWTAPEIPTWERDGVVLVGDAAHALPTTSGQGSSQAFEDVEAFTLFLAHELQEAYKTPLDTQTMTEKKAIVAAAKKYVALRLPHVKQILDHARKMQSSKRDMSVIEEYIMYCFMWIMGWFPSVMSKQFTKVAEYNIREEVEKVLQRPGESL